ncbi:MAG TPA: alcohol dehydrogenase catalytic domain-containing protein [Chloroflexota bacterium]|jgi:L-iditol 2-dehydrogenase|nr:alcohol dehydrogenase catalytic domain-containing protein [Chloroflexota bacterium]
MAVAAPEQIPQQMRAVVLTAPHAHEIRDIPTPHPGPLEVLCKVDSVAICGTDLHIYEGKFPGRWPKGYPFTPGHEWSGVVVEVGQQAAEMGWKVGERVAGTSHAGCGYCRMCMIGRYNLCENYGKEPLHHQYGHYSQGADAQYVVHSIKSVFKLPPELDLPYGSMIDTASIALHSAKRPGIRPGDVVVVVGSGPMGFLTADCAHALGAGRVIMTGGGERLRKAEQMGFEVVDYHKEDVVEAIKARTDGKGAHVAIDTGGTTESVLQAVNVLRKGGRASFTGIPDTPVSLPMQKIVLEEIDLYGVRANPNTMEEVIPLIVSGRVRVKELMTHSFPLEAYGDALHTFADRIDGALKVIIKPNA